MLMKYSAPIRILLLTLVLPGSYFSYSQERLDLMPYPKSVEVGKGKFYLKNDFQISLSGNYGERMSAEAILFLRQLTDQAGLFLKYSEPIDNQKATLRIIIKREGEVRIGEDESYEISVGASGIGLKAETDIGAARGLMTILQLIQADGYGYFLPYVQIHDAPRFVWRGLMIDVARHFMPLHVLYREIDAMSAVKLNVLHLHLSDDQGFRFQSEIFPELTDLASDGNYYTQQELKELVAYANQRGIMVIPEVDVPGHTTAIQVAFPGLGSKDVEYSLERYAGVFDPTLNPANEEVYIFLQQLFEEIANVFPAPYLHIGGDENLGKYWDTNSEIQAFKQAKGFKTNHELQTYFNYRLQKILSSFDKRLIGWDEIMTSDLGHSAIIHSWRGGWGGLEPKETLFNAAREGFETILSNGYYLDLIQPASAHYLVDPLPTESALTEVERGRVLGGEMCMWSELVTFETLDSRIWPRGAAVAERFWSPEEIKDVGDMYSRLEVISLWLEHFGLNHISEPRRIVRKLAMNHDPLPLKTLLSYVEPMKGYTRNPEGRMFSTFSPYTFWVDAAIPDAPKARKFNEAVIEYLANGNNPEQIQSMLKSLAENHEKLIPIINDSPTLSQIQELSKNASRVAVVGIQMLEYLESAEKPDETWMSNANQTITEASRQGGRTELQIIKGLTLLLDRLKTSGQ